MDQPPASAEDMLKAATVVALRPFEKTLDRLTFLKTIASSLFIALLVFIPFEAVSPDAHALDVVVTAGAAVLMFVWLWALVRMSLVAVTLLSLLVALLMVVLPDALLVSDFSTSRLFAELAHPENFLTVNAAVASFFPALIALCFAIDGVLVAKVDQPPWLFATAKPGAAGIGEILASAFGIHPITAWLPQRWRRLLAGSLFVLSAGVRGLTICLVLWRFLDPVVRSSVGEEMAAGVDKLIVIGLGVVLATALRYLARLFARVSVRNLIDKDQRPPILFLRSFKDDQVRLPGRDSLLFSRSWNPLRRMRRWLTVGEANPTLDHLVVEEATPLGPVVAIGVPGAPAPFGAARTYVSDDEWRNAVEGFAKASKAIVLVLDETAGVKWETMFIHDSRYVPKTLYLLPPRFTAPASSAVYLQHYLFKTWHSKDGASGMRGRELACGCVGWFQTADGRLVLLTSDSPVAASYVGALRLFQAYLTQGYVPVGTSVSFVEAAAAPNRRTVDNLFQTKRGIVVLLNDARLLAPVDGEYKMFESAKDYRDAFNDTDSWSEIRDETDKKNFMSSHGEVFGAEGTA